MKVTAVAKTLAYYFKGLITAVKSFIGQVPVVASGGSKGVDCLTHNSMIKGLNPDAGTSGACTIKNFTAVIYRFS